MSRFNIGDVFGGGLLIVAGLWFTVRAHDYTIGSLLNMGPGYFPRMIGVVTALIGGAIVLTSRREGVITVAWRALGAIAASVALFGVLLISFGLVPATFVATCAAACADPASRPLKTVILATILSTVMATVFIGALGLPLALLKGPF